MQGLELLRSWRKVGREMPVLILTARGSWTEKVEVLNAGADDYITKPSHIQEIAARLRALIRRSVGKPFATLVHNNIEVFARVWNGNNGPQSDRIDSARIPYPELLHASARSRHFAVAIA